MRSRFFWGVLIGIFMFLGGTSLLLWNEGQNAGEGDAIVEARRVAVEMPDVTKIAPEFEGKMVRATGFADAKDTLTDDFSGFKTTALSLNRSVEYYQWVERREGDSFSYILDWQPRPVDSSEFHRDGRRRGFENIVLTRVPSATMYADVSFGAYRLPRFLLQEMGRLSSVRPALNLTQDEISALNRRIFPNADSQYVHVRGNVIFLGSSPTEPRVGAVRVTYTEVEPAVFSILAKVTQDTFEPFKAFNDSTFSMVMAGVAGMEEMFGEAVRVNTTMTWVLRVFAVLLIVYAMKKFVAARNPTGAGLKALFLGLIWSFFLFGFTALSRDYLLSGLGFWIAAGLLIWQYRRRFKKKTNEEAGRAANESHK